MEKIYKQKDVLNIEHSSKKEPITWADVKGFNFEDNDVICAGYQEPEQYSDSSHEGFYYFTVTRFVIETDEEFERRKADAERQAKWNKEERYKRYLKLKREFENGADNTE